MMLLALLAAAHFFISAEANAWGPVTTVQGTGMLQPKFTEYHYTENCRKTCGYDKCQGTWSNPIPNGETWEKLNQMSTWGCCAWWAGPCQVCRKPGTQCTQLYGRDKVEREVIEAEGSVPEGGPNPAIGFAIAAGVAAVAGMTFFAAKKCKRIEASEDGYCPVDA